MRLGRRLALALALLGLALAAGAREAGPLRVGTSGDYLPFSRVARPGEAPEGFDVELLRAWAAERDRELVFVRFRWPDLLADLAAGRFDLAASGITVRPERSAVGRFTVPVAETSAWALIPERERTKGGRSAGEPSGVEAAAGGRASLDRPEIRIAVNAGGHLERVARANFPRATLLAVPDNAAVIELLVAGRVHAVVTDDGEAPLWEARFARPLARIGPLSRDRKAWWVRADRPELAADLDAWLLDREADGTLAALREKWLGTAGAATADPLGALLAAIDERLSLMPWIGAAKRSAGLPLVAPEREALVIERALADVGAEARSARRAAPPEAAVAALFRIQIDSAVRIQERAMQDPQPDPAALPDLDAVLRPALLRIGERITRLLLALPPDLDRRAVRAAARRALRAPHLDDALRDAIADAIAACTAGLAPQTVSE